MNEKTYIISYDLAKEGKYDDLFNHIKSYDTWAHITESTWAVLSTKTAAQVRDGIVKYLNENSRVIVIESANVAAWKNTICSNKWLKDNV